MLGNRGCLSGPDGEITSTVHPTHRGWICCVLDAGDGHRVSFDSPTSYTPLFALDEATFLSAGHRPCARCRPEAFAEFKACWAVAHGVLPETFVKAADIDRQLHRARLDRHGRQRTHRSRFGDLPDGAFCNMPAIAPRCPRAAVLVRDGRGHPWSHEGYGPPVSVPSGTIVNVLTPAPTVAVLREGYVPAMKLDHTTCKT